MRDFVILAVIAVLLIRSASAADPANDASENPAEVRTKSFLWEVSGSSNVVFLLGALWVRTNDVAPVNDKMRDAYLKSGAVWSSFIPEEAESIAIYQKYERYGRYPSDETIRDHLSKPSYQTLESMLSGATNDWQRNRPWFLGEAIVHQALRDRGYGGTNTIARHFLSLARRDYKPIASLEPPDTQINIFRRLSDIDQEFVLMTAWKEAFYFVSNAHEVYATWELGDVVKMDNINRYHLGGFLPVTRKLIYDRNHLWSSKIESMLHSGTNALVIVPARHLVGHESLLVLLEQKGFRVRQQ